MIINYPWRTAKQLWLFGFLRIREVKIAEERTVSLFLNPYIRKNSAIMIFRIMRCLTKILLLSDWGLIILWRRMILELHKDEKATVRSKNSTKGSENKERSQVKMRTHTHFLMHIHKIDSIELRNYLPEGMAVHWGKTVICWRRCDEKDLSKFLKIKLTKKNSQN